MWGRLSAARKFAISNDLKSFSPIRLFSCSSTDSSAAAVSDVIVDKNDNFNIGVSDSESKGGFVGDGCDDDLDKVVSLLKKSKSGGKRRSMSLDDDDDMNLSEEFVMRVLESSSISGEHLVGFFKKWVVSGKGGFGGIISSLCKAGMVKEAHSVYLFTKEKASQSTVNFLITSLCGDHHPNKKNDFVHLALKMLEDYYYCCYSGEDKRRYAIKQFSCVVQALCRVSDTQAAQALLSKMIHAGPPPGNAVFNTIINALSKSGDMMGAVNIMRIMEHRGLKPDVFAYTVIMSGYTKEGRMEEAAKFLAEAKKNHCKLTPVTFHTMIRGYCKLQQFGKGVKLLGEMEKYGVQPNADEYNKLIQSLCLKAADWEMAEKLMEDMTRKGLHLNGITKSLIRAVKELENEAATLTRVEA